MATTKKSVFETLSKVDVSAHLEKKGQFTYLSWAWAVMTLLKHYPNSTWKVHKWGGEGCRQPYMKTEAGAFVQVTVSVEGVDRTQGHPVLDHKNNTVAKPNSFQINTSIQRCLAKAIALQGLGLHIYGGEDLVQYDQSSDMPFAGAKPTIKKSIPKNGVTTGHKPNMKTGGDKSTISQHNYIMKLREDFMKLLGDTKGLESLSKIEKDCKLETLNVKEMTKQQASDYIEGLIQTYAKVNPA